MQVVTGLASIPKVNLGYPRSQTLLTNLRALTTQQKPATYRRIISLALQQIRETRKGFSLNQNSRLPKLRFKRRESSANIRGLDLQAAPKLK